MRDAHRMKEKFDVSLDNRQVVSLLIAGIIVMGAVFVLGVVVGKKLAGDAQATTPPDLLSSLDANAQALQQARETQAALTFQDELTRKGAAPEPSKPRTVTVAIPPPAPPPQPKPAEAPAAAPTEAAPPAASPTDDDYAPVAEAKPDTRPAAKPESKPDTKPAARPTDLPRLAESKPAPLPGKVASEPVPTRTTAPGTGTQEAIARATQTPTGAVAGGAFTLQLSAFQNRPEAERFASKLRDRGYAPFIVPAEVPNKGTWYRVRMGSFPSKDAASRYLADFKRETQLQAFVAGVN
ncbi:SPOR domain-containing protein [Melittangium boletus]|uniref:SPOR domain-containing protein n=1 Tax=Melittangium boletus TaxID=83453 RepID=UPI003DA29DA5